LTESKTDASQTRASVTLAAFIIFLAVNYLANTCKWVSRDKLFDVKESEIEAVATAYDNQPETNLALLGSSLLEVSAVQTAAIATNVPIKRLTHYRNEFLEQIFARDYHTEIKTMALAVGGLMVSDAYLVVEHLLCESHKPQSLIYCIGPRDFQDNLLPGLESSDTFKRLCTVSDLPDLIGVQEIKYQPKIDIVMRSLFSLYLCREQLQKIVADWPGELMPIYKKAPPKPVNNPVLHDVIYPGRACYTLGDAYMIMNYAVRYNPTNVKQMNTEYKYFERIIETCSKNHMQLSVVNMPLGPANLKALGPVAYRNYLSHVETICGAHQVPVLNLNIPPYNDGSNFLDTVHLNPAGSVAVFEAIAKSLGQSIVSAQK
jgi:hypothetical protein